MMAHAYRKWLLLAMGLWAGPALALDGLYFSGRAAPAGSLSLPGQDETVVYLRWDTVETVLPVDIVGFEIERNGVLLTDPMLPAHAVMEADEIQALYTGVAQQRRLLETVAALKRQELAGLDDADAPEVLKPLPPFALNNFGEALRSRLLDTQSPVPMLASRADFNVARARYRAYLDRPDPGLYQYELLAVSATGQRARVGLVSLDTQTRVTVLPPINFRQIFQGSCDSPDSGRDDYTVALGWLTPGNDGGVADRVASQLFISGYDLYRTTDNLAPNARNAPPRDLAAEARQLGHDNQGRIVYPGLEKVSPELLTLTGTHNEGAPLFQETRGELARAGLFPGDKRAYYLVPRDFAGQYGPTSAAVVIVPDNSRPPPPWNVSVYDDPAAATPVTELYWDPVVRERYLEAFGSGIRVCNDGEPSAARYLAVVDADEDCATGVQRRIRLPVAGYQIYRFNDFHAAAEFRDSDGDGVDDRVERPTDEQCDAESQPPGAISALVAGHPDIDDAAGAMLGTHQLSGGAGQLEVFSDELPPNNPGDVYWYRIASRTADGRLSHLSSPVRVNFPDRELPPPPDLTASRFTPDCLSCRLESLSPAGSWSFVDGIGSSDVVDVHCASATEADVPIMDLAGAQGDFCTVPNSKCIGTGQVSLTYGLPAPRNGARACTVDVPADVDFCRQGSVKLVPDECELEPIEPGAGITFGPLVVTGPPPPLGLCVTLVTEIAGRRSVIDNRCGGEVRVEIDEFPACVTGYHRDENGNVSPGTHLGCFGARLADVDSRPAPPQPVLLKINEGSADIRWRLPVDPVAVTLIELTREGHGEVRTASVAPANDVAASAVERFKLKLTDFDPAVSAGDSFCVRLRTVPPGADSHLQSEWSPPLCVEVEVDSPPEYLPWPQVREAPQIRDALFVPAQELVALTAPDIVGPESSLPAWSITRFVFGSTTKRDCIVEPTASGFIRPTCTPRMQSVIEGALQPFLSFLVFRQSRTPEGIEGDYIQVTPRIDFAYWEVLPEGDPRIATATRRFDDAWLRIYGTGEVDEFGIAYLDTYPVIRGYEYRYQIVHISPDNRIRAWRQSDWIAVDGGSP